MLTGDLNAKIGNEEIHNIVGSFGEPVTNTDGLKLRDGATYNNMKIMNSLYKRQKYSTYTQSASNSTIVTDYFSAKRKLSELFLDVRV